MFAIKMLRKIFGLKKEEVTGDWKTKSYKGFVI
jgi:hypothetical protein